MSLITWVKSWLSHRGKALSLYRAGMAKANKQDHYGAIADYSAAIRMPDIPKDVKAMAIYNRALSYSAVHDETKAAEDLSMLLKMPGLAERIKREAHRRLERLRKRHERTDC